MVETSSPPSQNAPSAPRTVTPVPAANAIAQQSCNLHADVFNTLNALTDDLRRFHLRVELAIAPDLTVKFAPGTLHAIIHAITTHAGTVASHQRMLIAALRRSAGIALVFTYEDGGQNLAMQEAALRSAQQQAALLGASLVIDVRSGIATTVTLILRDLPM